MADWSPAQLDRLEDALEDLEQPDAIERWLEDEPSPEVRERLTDYRSILEASREALPMEDVPDGLLDSVFAEAKRAATVAPMVATRESWWVRTRRSFMVPALALAGTTVLVLWIGRPDEAPTLAEETAPVPARHTPSSVRLEFVDSEDLDSPAPAASPDASERARSAGKKASGSKNKIGLGEGSNPLGGLDKGGFGSKSDDAKDREPEDDQIVQPIQAEPSPEPVEEQKPSAGAPTGPASGRWDIVSRGDRARQAGDCATARDEYALALEDDEPGVRARALAGIGLCDRRDGNEPSADANFDRARELDAGIDEFISSQATRRPSAKKRKSKKSRPKSKKPMQVDPFG